MSPVSSSLVPQFDVTVHVVLDDFGTAGRAYRETDEQDASFDRVIDDLMTGQFNNPIRVIAFNTGEGWSRDVSCLRGLRRKIGRSPALHAVSLNFTSAKKKCYALASQIEF